MTYSFSSRGTCKTDVVLDFDAKFDKLTQDMPVHMRDKESVLRQVREIVVMLDDPNYDEEIMITTHGYITDEPHGVMSKRTTAVSVSLTASIISKRK
jgi:hypothetical protein